MSAAPVDPDLVLLLSIFRVWLRDARNDIATLVEARAGTRKITTSSVVLVRQKLPRIAFGKLSRSSRNINNLIGELMRDEMICSNKREPADMLGKPLFAVAFATLAFATLPLGAPARAAVTVKAGILTCHVGSGYGFVFGSSRHLNCTYQSGGRIEHYTGDISKWGIDIGYLQSGVLVWAVLAPTTDLATGALSGEYGGLTAGAAVSVGADANALIGGSNREISLQPFSVGGEKGLNVAAGIASITLHARR
jgi:hypothetical protein